MIGAAETAFPPSSVAVSTTSTVPKSLQLNSLWLSDNTKLQLSVVPLSTAAGSSVYSLLASRTIETFWANTTGSSLSWTVTTAVWVAILPESSVAVTVTVTWPSPLSKSVQSKVEGVTA